MSTIKADEVTAVSSDGDITITGAGSGVVKLGDGALKFPDADGTSGYFIKTDGSAQLSFASATSSLTIGSEVATTSGSSVQVITGLSGLKIIHINFELVSLTGTGNLIIQLGDSAGLETSGYTGSGNKLDGPTLTYASSTAGFMVMVASAGSSYTGRITLTLKDSSNNTWIAFGGGRIQAGNNSIAFGAKSLSGTLTTVQLLTVSGSFDAGSVNATY